MNNTNPAQQDVVDILTADHHEVLDLLQQIKTSTDNEQRRELADAVIGELVRHSVAEEMYVYPAMRRHLPDGDEAVAGKIVEVHYVGVSWRNGKQFDASWDRGDTFKFGLGKGQVIKGWDDGVAGMRVGGRRRITIPPSLAYGKRGAGGVIGPDETLVFVVDLVGVR